MNWRSEVEIIQIEIHILFCMRKKKVSKKEYDYLYIDNEDFNHYRTR